MVFTCNKTYLTDKVLNVSKMLARWHNLKMTLQLNLGSSYKIKM